MTAKEQKIKEAYGEQFYPMSHRPEKDEEEFSKTVLVYDEDMEDFDTGYFDFESDEWVVFGGFSMKLICWCYAPNPKEFLKDKDFKTTVHRGYQP